MKSEQPKAAVQDSEEETKDGRGPTGGSKITVISHNEATAEPIPDYEGLTVVDLETLLDDDKAGHGAVDSDWNDYDYFLCVKKDGRIEDPFAEPRQ